MKKVSRSTSPLLDRYGDKVASDPDPAELCSQTVLPKTLEETTVLHSSKDSQSRSRTDEGLEPKCQPFSQRTNIFEMLFLCICIYFFKAKGS